MQRLNDYSLEIRKHIQNSLNNISGIIEGNNIQAYWYDEVVNFGDILTPLLLRLYGFSPIHAEKQNAKIICVGSILQDLREDFSGYIVGSGLIHDKQKRFIKAKILALRGKLTQERLGYTDNVILGDPGLLIHHLLTKRQTKKYKIGIIPHFVDKNNTSLRKLIIRYPYDIAFIDVQRYPREVIRDIDKCCYILSSSLHGLIAADSLGIPNAWFRFSDNSIGDFKFLDYASAFDELLTPVFLTGSENLLDLENFTHPVFPKVQAVTNNLDNLFCGLRTVIFEDKKEKTRVY